MNENKTFQIISDPVTGEPTTQCPHCGELGEVREVDRAERWNRLTVDINLEHGEPYAVAALGDADFESAGWICGNCYRRDIAAPSGFEIVDWF